MGRRNVVCSGTTHLYECVNCAWAFKLSDPTKVKTPLPSPVVFLGGGFSQWLSIAQTRFCDLIKKSPESRCGVTTVQYVFFNRLALRPTRLWQFLWWRGQTGLPSCTLQDAKNVSVRRISDSRNQLFWSLRVRRNDSLPYRYCFL